MATRRENHNLTPRRLALLSALRAAADEDGVFRGGVHELALAIGMSRQAAWAALIDLEARRFLMVLSTSPVGSTIRLLPLEGIWELPRSGGERILALLREWDGMYIGTLAQLGALVSLSAGGLYEAIKTLERDGAVQWMPDRTEGSTLILVEDESRP